MSLAPQGPWASCIYSDKLLVKRCSHDFIPLGEFWYETEVMDL